MSAASEAVESLRQSGIDHGHGDGYAYTVGVLGSILTSFPEAVAEIERHVEWVEARDRVAAFAAANGVPTEMVCR